MPKLKDYTDEELLAELKRRETKARVPKVLPNIDWSPVFDFITSEVNRTASEPESDRMEFGDFKSWVFESAMEVIYGKDIWNWWNEQF